VIRPTEPAWLDRRRILAVHSAQVREHGGVEGIRDDGLLDSALARPQNHFAYTGAKVPELAAIYAIAIARNHPFIDGNRRTAFVALELFLAMNGHDFTATDTDAAVMTLGMAAGEVEDDDFVSWVRHNTRPITSPANFGTR
jgi:death on curing protein